MTSLFQLAREFWKKSSRGTRKTLKGPKNNAKHIEAKQNWINRESKRIESAKLAEMQENLRVRIRNLESCLRGDQDSPRRPVARGRIDGQKLEPDHVSREHGGNSESRTTGAELAREGTASKRLAGWTRDGSMEEIASWSAAAERMSREVEAKKWKLQEAVRNNPLFKDVRMADGCLDGLDGSLSS